MYDAQANAQAGLPPSAHAETEWAKLQQDEETRKMQALQRQEEKLLRELPPGVKRTAAAPRPNAYIPDEVGIPKPYGQLAPFKPSESGAQMRHFRAPVAREIVV